MAKHRFRVTVEYIADNKGNAVTAEPLVFETENHDNILELAAKRAPDDKQRSFLVGLKLFGEAMLDDRDNPLFKDLQPHFGAFMKAFKASRKAAE